MDNKRKIKVRLFVKVWAEEYGKVIEIDYPPVSNQPCMDIREAALINKVSELERDNARLQMELDASCNAEELRQVRAENERLCETLKAVRELCTTDHESKERFIARVLLCLPNVKAQR